MKSHDFPDTAHLIQALTAKSAQILSNAIIQHGNASLVLSGGATPLPFYHALAECPLDWSKVQMTLSDERWSHSNYHHTNESQIKQVFAEKIKQGMQFYSLLTDSPQPQQAVKQVTAALVKIKRPFDIVLLGMGTDGHFASLFPQVDGLAEALNPDSAHTCTATVPRPLPDNAPYARMSLTLSALLNTYNLFLLITGQKKKSLIAQAQITADPMKLPVTALIQQTVTPVHIFWSP